MDLKGGEVVSLIHYSGKYMLMGVVYHADGDSLEVIPLQKHSLFIFFEEDPIVIGYKTNRDINLCECVIRNVDLIGHHIDLKINDGKFNTVQRLYERYPVSLYADTHSCNGVSAVFVKNLSLGGAAIVSRLNFSIEEEIKIDLHLDRIVVPVNARIIWKKTNKTYSDYGVKFIYSDEKSRTNISEYISNLEAEHEENLKKFKVASQKKKSKLSTELNYEHVCL